MGACYAEGLLALQCAGDGIAHQEKRLTYLKSGFMCLRLYGCWRWGWDLQSCSSWEVGVVKFLQQFCCEKLPLCFHGYLTLQLQLGLGQDISKSTLSGQGSMRVSMGIKRHHFFDSSPARRHLLLLLPSAIHSTLVSFTILHFLNVDYVRCTVGKKYAIAYSFNNEALAELVLRCSGHLSSLLSIFSTADTKYCMGNCFRVRATSSPAQTSVKIWTLES